MTVVSTEIRRTVPARAAQVPRLRHAVQEFVEANCPGDDDLRLTVALAVTEACTNVVLHAYPGGDGEILLTADIVDGQLVLEIIDHGIGLQDATATGSSGLGAGIPIMRRIADTQIFSGNHGTQVELRFPCS